MKIYLLSLAFLGAAATAHSGSGFLDRDTSRAILEAVYGRRPAVVQPDAGDSVETAFPIGSVLVSQRALHVSARLTEGYNAEELILSGGGGLNFQTSDGTPVSCYLTVWFSQQPVDQTSEQMRKTVPVSRRNADVLLDVGSEFTVARARQFYYAQKEGIRVGSGVTELDVIDKDNQRLKFHCSMDVLVHGKKLDAYPGVKAFQPLFVLKEVPTDLADAERAIHERVKLLRRALTDRFLTERQNLSPLDPKRWPDLYTDRYGNIYSEDLTGSGVRLSTDHLKDLVGRSSSDGLSAQEKQLREYFTGRSLKNDHGWEDYDRARAKRGIYGYRYESYYRFPNIATKDDGKIYYFDAEGDLQLIAFENGRYLFGPGKVYYSHIDQDVREYVTRTKIWGWL